MRGAEDRQARLAAVVNGVLVFGIPGAFVLLALVSAGNPPWPAETDGFRSSKAALVIESVQFGLMFAALATIAAWRTRVHALRFLAGQSGGLQGIGEAAAVAFIVAVLYLTPGIVTRPREAPPYVIFYGAAAMVLGAIVGLVLWAIARIVLGLSKSTAA